MWRYLISAGTARLADEMLVLALVLLVRWRTGDDVLSGVVLAAYTFPSIVSGPLLGAWLDRARRPAIALAGNQFVLGVMACALVFADAGWMPVLAFAAGLTLPLTSGGFTSMLPRLDADLPRVTAYDSMLFSASAVAGPALTGVLSAAISPVTAVVVICALSVAGGLCTVTLKLGPAPESSHGSLRAALRAGARHMVRTRPLLAATVTSVLSHGAIGVLAIALPAHVVSLGQRDGLAGLVWAVLDVGCVVSLVVMRRHLARWPPERILFTTVALYGLSLALWPVAPNFAVLLGLALLSGTVMGPTLASLITARQRYSPADLLGQVSTTGASMKIGAYALGAAIGGPLLGLGSSTVLLIVAACQLVAVAAGLLAMISSVDTPAA
ncbi:MFS transporter [Lentzea sp. PSKA42]|uniref:MFS transporter n=1 Tax=Lentzea indica TaxID=2604800 RepID=A0ABX1FN31_9PSEU|nr:MFS transporter [Lentzea indica]